MESLFSARALLCGLVLVAFVEWTNSFPLPNNSKDDLEKLKSTIQLNNLTATERQEGGSIFKEQLQKMEMLFGRDDQRHVVLEMLSSYSRLFHKMSKTDGQKGHNEAQNLHDKVQELLKLDNASKVVEMQHRLRDYKWNSQVDLLKALNDFDVVYERASALMTKK